MDKETLDILKLAGDLYALDCQDKGEVITSLNPYFSEDEPKHVGNWQKVDAVNHLLALIEMSSGARAVENITENMRYYTEQRDDGSFALRSLDESKWLLYADMVIIHTLAQINPLHQFMTTAEAESAFGLAPGTAKKAAQRGDIPAQKRGHDWLILRVDAEKRWKARQQ